MEDGLRNKVLFAVLGFVVGFVVVFGTVAVVNAHATGSFHWDYYMTIPGGEDCYRLITPSGAYGGITRCY